MKNNNWLSRPVYEKFPALTWEVLIFALILLATAFTRLFELGLRPMSHDESLHTYYSYLFFRDGNYLHNPMMHGPFQFHIIALTYFLAGVTDFTARFPAALFSIASVWMIWYWRRYLGKWGALAAAFMALISPYFMY